MSEPTDDDPRLFLENMITVISAIAGSVAGLAASAVTDVPIAGAIVSPFIAFQMQKAGRHLIESRIAPRQELRVAAAYVQAHRQIAARLQAGDAPRDDGFFADDASGRSPAEELTEATLAAARDAVEERKVPFIANLLAAIVFDVTIDRSTAHFMIATAERLSYRGFAILAVVGGTALVREEKNARESRLDEDATLIETMTLIAAGLVVSKQSPDTIGVEIILGPENLEPAKLHLSKLGRLLYECLGLPMLDQRDEAFGDVARIFSSLVPSHASSLSFDSGTA